MLVCVAGSRIVDVLKHIAILNLKKIRNCHKWNRKNINYCMKEKTIQYLKLDNRNNTENYFLFLKNVIFLKIS